MTQNATPFDLLQHLYGDVEMAELFSADRTVEAWKAVEGALAHAQGTLGIIPEHKTSAIQAVCADPDSIDHESLWQSARTVGYPILGLVRQIDAALAEEDRGSVHFGATTQDIMDSGLALQLDEALALLECRLTDFGSGLAALVTEHAMTVMPGRTHGQQAVPTTLGAKLAVFLAEVTRHRLRLLAARDDVRCVSLFGAGGTSAALGEDAAEIRTLVAERLGLVDTVIPWHVARDSIVHAADIAAGAAATATRLAREVADLSRTEIGELGEAKGHHRGASSTMPQKANPIYCESIIGLAVAARSAAAGLSRAAEAGHERSTGEWQVEWTLLPALFVNTSSALKLSVDLTRELAVYPERMRENLAVDGGLIMSEAVMISLAPHLGREDAHDVVYELALKSRATKTSFTEVLSGWLAEHPEIPLVEIEAGERSVGQAGQICSAAVDSWTASLTSNPRPWKETR